jgi:hypothetical protein
MLQKLSLDSKQELTIDPRVVGLGPEDEMDITSICKRESYLTKFTWTVAATSDAFLFNIPVSPTNLDANATQIFFTPMAFVSQAFTFWRGTLNFRFVVVASAHHKGKLRISFDPFVQIVASPTNVNYNRVIDIATTKDFTIPISWCQETAFKGIDPSWAAQFSTVPLSAKPAYWNGIMSVYCHNELSVPNASTPNDIEILAFLSAGDDFEVAVPFSSQIANLSVFTNQSGVDGAVATAGVDPGATAQEDDGMPLGTNILSPVGQANPIGSLYDVFFGEKVSNLRYLFKRYTNHCTYFPPTSARVAGQLFGWSVWWHSFPMPYGYDPSGTYTTSGAKLKKYNPVNQSFLAYFAPLFLMRRGGTRWKLVGHGTVDNNRNWLVSYRKTVPLTPGTNIISVVATNFPAQNAAPEEQLSFASMQFPNFGAEGMCADDFDMGSEAEVPFYTNSRFTRCRAFDSNASAYINRYGFDHVAMFTTTQQIPSVQAFVAAAEDLSFHFFVSVPILYGYALDRTI